MANRRKRVVELEKRMLRRRGGCSICGGRTTPVDFVTELEDGRFRFDRTGEIVPKLPARGPNECSCQIRYAIVTTVTRA